MYTKGQRYRFTRLRMNVNATTFRFVWVRNSATDWNDKQQQEKRRKRKRRSRRRYQRHRIVNEVGRNTHDIYICVNIYIYSLHTYIHCSLAHPSIQSEWMLGYAVNIETVEHSVIYAYSLYNIHIWLYSTTRMPPVTMIYRNIKHILPRQYWNEKRMII